MGLTASEGFLVAVIVILSVIMIGVTAMVAVIYGHPDDANEAWFPRIVVVLGLWVAFASVLVLPYDVAVARSGSGGLRIDILWQIIYFFLAFMVVLIIPFAYFFYENDVDEADVKNCWDTQTGSAICYTLMFFAVFITILMIMYSFLNVAEIPVVRYRQGYSGMGVITTGNQFLANGNTSSCTALVGCSKDLYIWGVDVTFPIFLMAFLSFIGWFFWTFFVGVGLVALPLDLINEYRTRPEPMSSIEYFKEREKLGRRADDLYKVGNALFREQVDTSHDQKSSAQKSADRNTMIRFEQAYYMLKRDHELLEAAAALRGRDFSDLSQDIPLNLNPLWYIMKLVFGIIGIILSITWVIHIALFVLPIRPIHPFLNDFFIKLENVADGQFPLFGVLAYAIYSFYLLWCCIKGNFRLGIRLAFWKIYPMEPGKTRMNAFLANTWVIMLCSVPTIQFCVFSFPLYARETQVDMLFGTQIMYLRFLKYFWENNVFIIAMLCVTFLAGIYLGFKPIDRAAEIEEQLKKIASLAPEERVEIPR